MRSPMSIIELATKRLEDMTGAGVQVPWTAAGLEQSDVQKQVETKKRRASSKAMVPVKEVRAVDAPASTGRELLPTLPMPLGDAEGPVTAKLNLKGLERSGRVVPTQTRSSLGEEFSHIKRQLLKNARSKEAAENRLSLIMVTSALPGDGKTFCAINLAMSMAAEVDTSVLLVDADVVRPEVLNRLGLRPAKGLLDVLTDPNVALRDVILRTNVPKLSILPAGTPNRISTELLASDAMETLLETFVKRYPGHVVIFDAPPLLVTNEANVLASRVGQVVLIVKASTTPRRAVGQVLAALEECPVVLTVLNQVHEPEVPRGYGYYHD
jgi:protein-tyrosine kinase